MNAGTRRDVLLALLLRHKVLATDDLPFQKRPETVNAGRMAVAVHMFPKALHDLSTG